MSESHYGYVWHCIFLNFTNLLNTRLFTNLFCVILANRQFIINYVIINVICLYFKPAL